MKLPNMLVILSAARPHHSEAEEEAAFNALKKSISLPNAECLGHWRGSEERSLLVQCEAFVDVGRLVARAKEFQQEAILLVDANDNAFIYWINTRVMESKGPMYKSKDVPSSEAHTFFNGYYYYTL